MGAKEKQPIDWSALKRLAPFIKPYRFRLTVGILMGLLYGVTTSGLLIAVGWATGIISGEDISQGADLFGVTADADGRLTLVQVIKAIAVLPVIAILNGLTFFIGKYFVEWVGNRVVADIRLKMFSHIHSLPLQFFSQSRSGELISRITNDTTQVQFAVSRVIVP